jgi:hypothetical protein
MFSK